MTTSTKISIDGRNCRMQQFGQGGPIIVWGMYSQNEYEFAHLTDCVNALCPDAAFLLAAFEIKDWNRDLSPWPADAAPGTAFFEGKGKDTLNWLTESLLPAIRFSSQTVYLIGYSLAGLFALWSGYEAEAFSGIACCSGSLWYPGWDTFVSSHTLQRPCSIYLSLGGKEEKSASIAMASVGVRTRAQEKILKEDPMVSSSILEWNSGGHFADSGKRLAKGIRWLLAHPADLK